MTDRVETPIFRVSFIACPISSPEVRAKRRARTAAARGFRRHAQRKMPRTGEPMTRDQIAELWRGFSIVEILHDARRSHRPLGLRAESETLCRT